MHEYFYWGYEATVLFSWWKSETAFEFYLSCGVVICLNLLSSWLKQVKLDIETQHFLEQCHCTSLTSSPPPASSPSILLSESVPFPSGTPTLSNLSSASALSPSLSSSPEHLSSHSSSTASLPHPLFLYVRSLLSCLAKPISLMLKFPPLHPPLSESSNIICDERTRDYQYQSYTEASNTRQIFSMYQNVDYETDKENEAIVCVQKTNEGGEIDDHFKAIDIFHHSYLPSTPPSLIQATSSDPPLSSFQTSTSPLLYSQPPSPSLPPLASSSLFLSSSTTNSVPSGDSYSCRHPSAKKLSWSIPHNSLPSVTHSRTTTSKPYSDASSFEAACVSNNSDRVSNVVMSERSRRYVCSLPCSASSPNSILCSLPPSPPSASQWKSVSSSSDVMTEREVELLPKVHASLFVSPLSTSLSPPRICFHPVLLSTSPLPPYFLRTPIHAQSPDSNVYKNCLHNMNPRSCERIGVNKDRDDEDGSSHIRDIVKGDKLNQFVHSNNNTSCEDGIRSAPTLSEICKFNGRKRNNHEKKNDHNTIDDGQISHKNELNYNVDTDDRFNILNSNIETCSFERRLIPQQPPLMHRPSFKVPYTLRIWFVCFIAVTIDWALMLVCMTFNAGLFASVCLGVSLGNCIFRKRPSLEKYFQGCQTTHCFMF